MRHAHLPLLLLLILPFTSAFTYNGHELPCNGGITAQATEIGALVNINETRIFHGFNTSSNDGGVTPRDTWGLYEYNETQTPNLTMLAQGNFSGSYQGYYYPNDTFLKPGYNYYAFTNTTAPSDNCYVNSVNGAHNISISMGGVTIQYAYRMAHFPPQVYTPNGFEGMLNGIFLDTPTICTPDWHCTSYTTCVNSTQYCDAVSDHNTCNTPYTGNYSEFSPQSCTTTYTPDYTAVNIAPATISTLVSILITIGSFSVIIVLILGFKYFPKKN